MSTITKLLERTYRERIITPTIIRYESGKKMDVLSRVRDWAPTEFMGAGATGKLGEGLINNLRAKFQGSVISLKDIGSFNMMGVGLTSRGIEELADDRNVKDMFLDKQMWALQYPTVPEEAIFSNRRIDYFTSTKHTKRLMGCDRANQQGYGGEGILVSVPDTGGTRTHRSYSSRFEYKSLMKDKGQIADKNAHGTWCVGCIGGKEIDDRTYSPPVPTEGMAPGVDLLGIKVLGYVIGTGFTSDIIQSMEYSLEKGADVVSMSLGGPAPEEGERDPQCELISAISDNGVTFVVAGGNSGPDSGTIGSPGTCPKALTVGAYDPSTGEIADFSSRGPTPEGDIKPDVIAPGVNTHAPVHGMLGRTGDKRNQRFAPLSGTSMATPHTAGLVALMKQAKRDLVGKDMSTEEIKRMCKELGESKNNTRGWGFMKWSWFERWLSTEYGIEEE